MRVVFTVFAAKTHLFNLVPLAWALRAAGHEVVVATQPDLADAVARAGLTAVPVGEALGMGGGGGAGGGGGGAAPSSRMFETMSGDLVKDPAEPLTWERALGAFTVACPLQYEYFAGRQVLDDLVELCRSWRPDLVVWDALTFSGPVAARASGAAHARMLFGMDYVSQMYLRYRELRLRQPPERREDPVADWLRGRLARHGLGFDEADAVELMTGQWSIDPTPPWMRLPLDLPYVPVRQLPYNGPTGVPEWLAEPPDRPRICLSLGMSGRDLFGGDTIAVGDILEALADLDVELVATLSAEQLATVGTVPENVRAVDFVPLNELLPSCAAAIHHGGFGTVVNVLAHAVPHLTVPAQWWDEADLGTHIAAGGAGLVADGPLTPEGIRDRVVRLLDDPSFAEGARRMRGALAEVPTPAGLVPRLVELTALHRP
ncbi:activator-dependent family glycosyltransferase [Streptomyces sp. NPDC056503]|uniref:activator-dependent family glycosyltransferase n=1 Tax=Streptomyces sp. NPDC056503 TaxID=3345842 RepID=UPI00369E07A7